MKSTVDEIRRRFDADVERFSNLETGQSATVDAPLAMALVARSAAAATPHARHVLDVGARRMQELDGLGVAARIAIGDSLVEALEHVLGDQRLELITITGREGADDHLVSAPGAGQEMADVEGGVAQNVRQELETREAIVRNDRENGGESRLQAVILAGRRCDVFLQEVVVGLELGSQQERNVVDVGALRE